MPSSIEEAAAAAGQAADINPNQNQPAEVPAKQEGQAPAKDQSSDPKTTADVKPAEKADEPKMSVAEKAKAHIKSVLDKPTKKDKDDGMTDEEFEKIIKPNAKAWRVYEAFKKTSTEKLTAAEQKAAQLESRIKEIEGKASPTAADAGRLALLEKQLEELTGQSKSYRERLVARDYRESDDYKSKFVEPWESKYKEAYNFVSRLKVREGDEERQATPNDFDLIMRADPPMRRALARQIFGEDFQFEIAEFARDLSNIEASANKAVRDHAANYETTQKQQMEAKAKEVSEYSRMKEEARAAMVAEFPEYFSPDHYKDQPELKEALESGYAFIDDIESKANTMTIEDRAASGASIRARAAGFSLLYARDKLNTEKIAALTAELKKLRGSDPGSDTKPSGESPKTGEVGGIRDMVGRVAWDK